MPRITSCVVVLVAWGLLAAWQRHEYVHERDLIRETLVRQADSVMNAVVSGIRSHRWLGPFIRDQLPGTLEELVKSDDILAVALAPQNDGQERLAAGAVQLIEGDYPVGQFWDETGYRLVIAFELDPNLSSGPRGGAGTGRGGGRGRGFNSPHRTDGESPLSTAERFKAILLLDSAGAEAQCRRAAWNRGSLVISGGLLLACIVVAWQVRVRFVEERGRARVLETESHYLRELSQASAGLAHETRNPLGLVRGWTQRLADSKLDSYQQKQADAILEECDRITARISQFLTFARPCETKIDSVDLGQLIDELKMLLEPDLDAKHLTLQREEVSTGQTIQADREMLRQALFNLIQNAIQFAPDGTAIQIVVRVEHGKRMILEVIDSGPGVANDAVPSLFTPYFTTRPDGTGLGLAIVRRIATAHGWQIDYVPQAGGGSNFRLSEINV